VLCEAGLVEETFTDELRDELLHLLAMGSPPVCLVAQFLLAALLPGAIGASLGQQCGSGNLLMSHKLQATSLPSFV